MKWLRLNSHQMSDGVVVVILGLGQSRSSAEIRHLIACVEVGWAVREIIRTKVARRACYCRLRCTMKNLG